MKKYSRWRSTQADRAKKSRQLLAATLMIGGACSIGFPVFANSTKAGTQIDNRATATYTDGTPTTYNATSNTVTIRVAEVAGITIAAQPPSNPTPNPGDTLHVDFLITNIGNDPTQFFVPGTATLSNGTSFAINGDLQIVAVNGTDIAPIVIPNAGATTGTLLSADASKGSFAPNGTIKVRVPIRVSATAPQNANTTVSLGNTTPIDQKNVDRTANPNDVYTVDNPDPSSIVDEVPGAPAIVREAMDTSTTIAVNSRLQAFATILKAASSYSNNNTPAVLSDDTLTYSLALRVDSPSPTPGLTVSDLHGTDITLDNATVPRILISDAIPVNTVLSATNPIAPTGWEVVYSTTDLGTPAHKAEWFRFRPAGTITRVGFVRTGPVLRNTTVSGFEFSVTPIAGFRGGQIANIAQVFGQSLPGAVVPGTPTQLVYDESGDQSSNNQLNGDNPDPTSSGAPATGLGIGTGVANPNTDGTDPGIGTVPTDNTTNQGSTTDPDGGETTIYSIAASPLNGPQDTPDAVGPTSDNDDFTNRSIVPPVGLDPSIALTDAQTPEIEFTNTVRNTSTSAETISLVPVLPGTLSDLPNGTIVTISNGTDNAVYRYDGTQFILQSGATVRLTNVGPDDNAPAGADQRNYTVRVNLPGADPVKGYPVSIAAFIDQDNNGALNNEPSNITINQVYTGYVTLLKEARILEADGITEVAPFNSSQATLNAAARPGRIIEYRITYQNISTAQTGSANGNRTLSARSLSIVEDGSAAPNNWFSSTTDPVSGVIPGSATDPKGVITGSSSNGNIQVYVDTISQLDPQNSGTFIFRRKIN